MPRPTKIQTQSDLIYTAEGLLAVALASEDDPDLEQLALFEDEEAFEADLLADNTSELLEVSALNWIEIAQRMDGDGSRGPYDQIPKSADFFSAAQMHPDLGKYENNWATCCIVQAHLKATSSNASNKAAKEVVADVIQIGRRTPYPLPDLRDAVDFLQYTAPRAILTSLPRVPVAEPLDLDPPRAAAFPSRPEESQNGSKAVFAPYSPPASSRIVPASPSTSYRVPASQIVPASLLNPIQHVVPRAISTSIPRVPDPGLSSFAHTQAAAFQSHPAQSQSRSESIIESQQMQTWSPSHRVVPSRVLEPVAPDGAPLQYHPESSQLVIQSSARLLRSSEPFGVLVSPQNLLDPHFAPTAPSTSPFPNTLLTCPAVPHLPPPSHAPTEATPVLAFVHDTGRFPRYDV
ncbi:hypothetical protein B0H14DRAFT_3474107 [Mycena olivaceomarginata]|nr:hypothetical protein B0H14DRAFT_3474107 [Mycena olivaceomarginata]